MLGLDFLNLSLAERCPPWMRCTDFAKAGVGHPPQLLAGRALKGSFEGCRPGLACLPEPDPDFVKEVL
jgi:hypothetical protein